MFSIKTIRIQVVLVIIMTMANGLCAQEELYITRNGDLRINTVFNDTSLILTSGDVEVTLNYENAEVTLKIFADRFRCLNPYIDSLLRVQGHRSIIFKGKLGIDYINTKSHPPLDFDVEGYLEPGQFLLKGKGHLEHLYNGSLFACILDIHFHLPIKYVIPEDLRDGFSEMAHIDVVHTVLKRSSEE